MLSGPPATRRIPACGGYKLLQAPAVLSKILLRVEIRIFDDALSVRGNAIILQINRFSAHDLVQMRKRRGIRLNIRQPLIHQREVIAVDILFSRVAARYEVSRVAIVTLESRPSHKRIDTRMEVADIV